MVFGGVDEERIVLNESSVWSGSPEDADRPDATRRCRKSAGCLLEGKNAEAENLVDAQLHLPGHRLRTWPWAPICRSAATRRWATCS